MFKKIDIWILYLVLVFVLISYIIFGAMVIREHDKGGHIPIISSISKVAYFFSTIPRNLKKALSKEIKSPFAAKENRFKNQYGFNGNPNVEKKYLLLSRYDGFLIECVVELIDLKTFQVLHTWNPDINSILNEVDTKEKVIFENLKRDRNDTRFIMTHPYLNENGNLTFHNHSPLFIINSNSNLIHIKDDNIYHHSNEVDFEGNLWVCVKYFPFKIDKTLVGTEVSNYHDDGIRLLSPQLEILYDKSITEIFIENKMDYLLFSTGDRGFEKDPIHLNDIEPVNFNSKYWRKGDIFLSLRHQSMILLFRPSSNEILWIGTGPFYHQHDVDILDQNRISIFNNNSKDTYNKEIVDGNNQVIIYNFETDKYSLYLDESLKKHDVRTITEGRSQILPNGDLFIEETNYGRNLYFNSDGSLRWEFVNRSKNGDLKHVSWSRIFYSENDIKKVQTFLKLKNKESHNE